MIYEPTMRLNRYKSNINGLLGNALKQELPDESFEDPVPCIEHKKKQEGVLKSNQMIVDLMILKASNAEIVPTEDIISFFNNSFLRLKFFTPERMAQGFFFAQKCIEFRSLSMSIFQTFLDDFFSEIRSNKLMVRESDKKNYCELVIANILIPLILNSEKESTTFRTCANYLIELIDFIKPNVAKIASALGENADILFVEA